MNLERIVGLLLGVVALATVAYLAKVIAGIVMRRPIRMSDLATAGKRVARAFAEHGDAKPVNDHMIAARGKVVSHSADEARPMRVRVGLELWYAKLDGFEPAPLPVGTPIEVTRVEGTILTVEARLPPNESDDRDPFDAGSNA